MTSRVGKPDTQADIELRECLDEQPARSFVMVAGAGAGKTTSLIKALQHLAVTRGSALRRAGQKIACVTYTDVAVREIWGDVGNAPLFHVSTIHSFLWSVISPFQVDIRNWVADRIREKITEKREHYNKPRTQQKTKDRLALEIAGLEEEMACLERVPKFTYGMASSYADGILGHDDILKLAPACIEVHPLLRQLIASRFPYIFVDESQDTNPIVVEALRRIAVEQPSICIGFFGDPMQKIYMTGAGPILLEHGWREITKPENFRCPTSVLNVVNAVRAAGDGLEQTRGRTVEVDGVSQPVVGSAQIFVLPADEHRTERLDAIRRWLRRTTDDPLWLSDNIDADVRLLVLVHRMAAARLGFANLYAALHDKAPDSLKGGLEDGSAWPLRTLLKTILPIVLAARAGDQFTVMAYLKAECPLLQPERVRDQGAPAILQRLQNGVNVLVDMLGDASITTIKEILTHVRGSEMLLLDERFNPFLEPEPVDDGGSGFKNLVAFLECGATELWGYRKYIEEESPFATQQGVKGAQFERVLVILDEEEGSHSHFSYGKYFEFVPLSDKDEENIKAGIDSVLDRTRRLFYVCCSRAVKDLAVVIFTPEVDQARAAIERVGLFPPDAIFGLDELHVALN